MTTRSTVFMPPLTCATGGNIPYKDSRGQSHAMLRHSVITIGSPTGGIINTRRDFRGVVEGNRTGEDRVAVTNSRRRTQDPEDSVNHRELAQLSSELQDVLAKLRQKTKEEQKTRRKLGVLSIKLEEETARRALLVGELFDHVQLQLTFLQNENRELRHQLEQMEGQSNVNARKFEEECGTNSLLIKQQKQKIEDLREEKLNLREQMDKLQKEKIALEESLEQSQQQQDSRELNFSKKVQMLEADLMQTQAQLQRANRELTEARSAIDASEVAVQQVRLFVQLICQPNFHVVKDESLTPVEKGRPSPTGFVLVPLTVMLHGYTLLSPNDRRDIIETYQVHLP